MPFGRTLPSLGKSQPGFLVPFATLSAGSNPAPPSGDAPTPIVESRRVFRVSIHCVYARLYLGIQGSTGVVLGVAPLELHLVLYLVLVFIPT